MKDKKQLIVPVLAGLVVVAWIFLFYLPYSQQIGSYNNRLKELEKREADRISPMDITIQQNKVDSLKVKLDNTLKAFYPEDKLLDLGRTMGKVGRDYGLTLVSIVPDHSSLSILFSNQQISELPVTVIYSGRFMRLASFLDKIAHIGVSFKLTELKLERPSFDSRDLQIELNGVILINTRISQSAENKNKA